jgi:putative phosphoribosyl transferase
MPYSGRRDVIVLALPRGGVPVAYEIARALHAPLDIYIVRKLGVPGHEELAMGAIASDGSYIIDQPTLQAVGITSRDFEIELRRQFAEVKRREAAYRDDLPEPELAGKIIIVVDDGLATGASMYSAADRVVCPCREHHFRAVGPYYENFEQVPDEEVTHLFRHAQAGGENHKTGAGS